MLPLPEFKALVREQFYMLLIDEDAALIGDSEDAAGGCRRCDGRRCDMVKRVGECGWADRGRNADAVGADRAAVRFGR